jgi:hypothetical protein
LGWREEEGVEEYHFRSRFPNNSVYNTFVSTAKPNRVMMLKEVIAVYCENNIKQRVNKMDYFIVKANSTNIYHCA